MRQRLFKEDGRWVIEYKDVVDSDGWGYIYEADQDWKECLRKYLRHLQTTKEIVDEQYTTYLEYLYNQGHYCIADVV